MRPQSNGLTMAEWYLMECLWEHAPRTGREIIEDMKQRQDWSRSTTLTMLRRMTEKEQIECREENGIRVYSPLIPREEALREETDSFLRRAYQGSVSLLFSALTRQQKLNKEEIDELYEILRQAEKKEEDHHD